MVTLPSMVTLPLSAGASPSEPPTVTRTGAVALKGEVEGAAEQQLLARRKAHGPADGCRSLGSAEARPGHAAVPGRRPRRRPQQSRQRSQRLAEQRRVFRSREVDALAAHRHLGAGERVRQTIRDRRRHVVRHRAPEAREPHLLQGIGVQNRPRRLAVADRPQLPELREARPA